MARKVKRIYEGFTPRVPVKVPHGPQDALLVLGLLLGLTALLIRVFAR